MFVQVATKTVDVWIFSGGWCPAGGGFELGKHAGLVRGRWVDMKVVGKSNPTVKDECVSKCVTLVVILGGRAERETLGE